MIQEGRPYRTDGGYPEQYEKGLVSPPKQAAVQVRGFEILSKEMHEALSHLNDSVAKVSFVLAPAIKPAPESNEKSCEPITAAASAYKESMKEYIMRIHVMANRLSDLCESSEF